MTLSVRTLVPCSDSTNKSNLSQHYRVTLETCDLWDIWSEWWEDMTWPKKTYPPTYLPTYLPIYLCTSIREHPKGAILGTCDLLDIWSDWWGDMTWPKKTQATHLPTYLATYLPTYLSTSIREHRKNWATFLAVHRQLNRWPCLSVRPLDSTNNQTFHNTTEWP